MSRSANKKNKVPKISEEEYAKYINALKSGGAGGTMEEKELPEEPPRTEEK